MAAKVRRCRYAGRAATPTRAGRGRLRRGISFRRYAVPSRKGQECRCWSPSPLFVAFVGAWRSNMPGRNSNNTYHSAKRTKHFKWIKTILGIVVVAALFPGVRLFQYQTAGEISAGNGRVSGLSGFCGRCDAPRSPRSRQYGRGGWIRLRPRLRQMPPMPYAGSRSLRWANTSPVRVTREAGGVYRRERCDDRDLFDPRRRITGVTLKDYTFQVCTPRQA